MEHVSEAGVPRCPAVSGDTTPYWDYVTCDACHDLRDKLTVPDQTNPKDLLGAKKLPMTLFPMTAVAYGNRAMFNGAEKYGPYNWRKKKVKASIYVDAAFRHIAAYFERQELADDSGAHHLGHAMACLAIIVDAKETGNLIDDRPEDGAAFLKCLERMNDEIKARVK